MVEKTVDVFRTNLHESISQVFNSLLKDVLSLKQQQFLFFLLLLVLLKSQPQCLFPEIITWFSK